MPLATIFRRLGTVSQAQLILSLALTGLTLLPACATAPQDPPEVDITPMETTSRAARSPDCAMPLLYNEPTAAFRKVAIVEGWANVNTSRTDLLELIRKKACETGADAVLVLQGGKQDPHKLVYGVTPNRGTEATTSGDIQYSGNPDSYLDEMERVPDVGEVGHPGTYIDTVAIVYTKVEH